MAADDSTSSGPVTGPDDTLTDLAQRFAEQLGDRTVASAESFTAGLIAQSIASVAGSAAWFHGGIVAYRSEMKHTLLGVEEGPVVTESCAVQMARGAAERFGTDIALATTGVAGPGPEEGRPPGTVVIGWCIEGTTGAVTFDLAGNPDTLLHRGARAALEQLGRELAGTARPAAGDGDAVASLVDDADDAAADVADEAADTAQPSSSFSRKELPPEQPVTVVEGGDPGDGGD